MDARPDYKPAPSLVEASALSEEQLKRCFLGRYDYPADADADFQHGAFSTTQDHPSMQRKRETVRRIVLERPYAQPPQAVVTWPSGFPVRAARETCGAEGRVGGRRPGSDLAQVTFAGAAFIVVG
ncbi:uncharacterized protein H6S33_003261 [Morchella sextelata]|uniref:uncharacterized protein n=1 Tax=Morchella sextelata TaxID=1174677 RepID=UPI001D03D34D|nr:uncharacterized protein H6S33_003261 [Morchella sextelata]KAH0607273.1 hypothetical protein H6S33_003261 [Morchella sextelata]